MKNQTLQCKNVSFHLKNGTRLLLLILVTFSMLGTFSSCNSKKKMAANDLAQRLEKAKQDLTAVLNDGKTMSIEDMEQTLNRVKSQNFDTPYVKKLQPKVKEVKELIGQVEKKIANEKQKVIDDLNRRLLTLINDDTKSIEELEKELAEIKNTANKYSNAETQKLISQLEQKIRNMKAANTVDNSLEANFNRIVSLSKAGNIDQANAEIQKTLTLFESPETPVLIIVAIEGTIIDYDKPTTIEAYLNYLKDQKISRNVVKEVEKNAFGKIKVLELIKK